MIFSLLFSIIFALNWHVKSNDGTARGIQVLAEAQVDSFVLEPWIYRDDFEDRDLGAWASYPLWQDIAYNQNFRVNEMIPGDPNISIVQKVTPYTAVDNYAGAQKLLDMYLVPGATLNFRYYLKTNQNCAWYKVRFAAGSYGKLEIDIPNIKANQWQRVSFSFEDLVEQNPILNGKEKVKIFAMAHLVKFPNADPDMPIYFGLDDIVFTSARAAEFQFTKPEMHKLPEFKTYIPVRHYYTGDLFELQGHWISEALRVTLSVTGFSDTTNVVVDANLFQENDLWQLDPVKLDFPLGLYQATLKAFDDERQIGQTTFTIHIAPRDITGKHPRLLFDDLEKEEIGKRFGNENFKKLYADMSVDAKSHRLKITPESLVYDLDQFPDEDWLVTWNAWGSRIYHTGEALRSNARVFAFHDDQEAGNYVKDILLRLASWPDWTHPWQTKRGRYSEHRTGSWAHRVAEAYDLVYPLFTPDEREKICSAIFKNIVQGVHRTYIYNDNITAATSNWLAMTVGGSLMCLSAMYDDTEKTKNIEPYFTGAILKLDRFINRVTDSKNGGWGEGFGYNNYSLSNLSYSLPSLENVFNVDLSRPLVGTYNEYIWSGLIKSKRWFEYGDSHGHMTSAKNWAYLLSKYQEPRLSWFYHFLNDHSQNYVANAESPYGKTENPSGHNYTYEDVLFNTLGIPQEDPFLENPVKVFQDLGTVVFKSGWEKEDFVFVMRSGPAYNHQHMDQGSFWLADRGTIFIEERPLGNSDYYEDPLYESWLTQPIGHSTILINGNHQSQRVGDHLEFAPGFDDYAFISHFIDGQDASFVTGDIGRLYWGKVQELSRNVLYLKPGAVLMLDVAYPADEDVDVTLLYQTAFLKDIQKGDKKSSITKDSNRLHIFHISPVLTEAEAIETPHYLKTLRNDRPLEREGMLTITGHTDGLPLVLANLLTTSKISDVPALMIEEKDGYVQGVFDESNFAFSTNPENTYSVGAFTTDALTLSWNEARVLAAKTRIYKDDKFELKADEPITFEWSKDGRLKYTMPKDALITLGPHDRSTVVLVNGKNGTAVYDSNNNKTLVSLKAGEGIITIK